MVYETPGTPLARVSDVCDDTAVSVIVPAFQNPADLSRCLAALSNSTLQPLEVIVIDDGSRVHSDEIAECCGRHGARYLRQAHNRGPAAARNAGARVCCGNLIVFFDADVAPHTDTLQSIVSRMSKRPRVDALFGAYDQTPTATGTLSRFRNLLHHFHHVQSAGKATTFWAGCGAIRRDVFAAAGGFSESYIHPSVEDVELGFRLEQAGFSIELNPAIQVTHLKQWTLRGMFETDLFLRAAPWAELFWQWRGLPRRLNFGLANRLCAALAGAIILALVMRRPMIALAMAASIFLLNIPFYRFIGRTLGVAAIPICAGAHLVHYWAALLGFLLGTWHWLRKKTFRRQPASLVQ